MILQDLIVTPLFLILIYGVLFALRPRFTNNLTYKYFIPAVTVKFLGAIALALIYQFHYPGYGDTFAFFHLGSKIIWESILESPVDTFKLIFTNGMSPDLFKYTSRIYYINDHTSYVLIRILSFFDVFTFHTYSSSALFFSLVSFSGAWAMFKVLSEMYPAITKQLAIILLFVPSVCFWGSGILKDTITYGLLGWLFYASYYLVVERSRIVRSLLILIVSSFIIYKIKIYILMCFMPAVIIWFLLENSRRISSPLIRFLIGPLSFGIAIVLSYYAVQEVSAENQFYAMNKISDTASTTAKYLYYQGKKQGGSYYSLGDFDFSTAGLIRKIPLAIVTSLFRPFIIEAKNIVMMLSGLENALILYVTLVTFFRVSFRQFINAIRIQPLIMLCLVFSISFAYAIGFSTYNFGTLVRYRIPLIPFYLLAIYLINYHSNKLKLKKLI